MIEIELPDGSKMSSNRVFLALMLQGRYPKGWPKMRWLCRLTENCRMFTRL